VTVRSERLLYQRAVQMMARGNEDGGWSAGLRRACAEAEFGAPRISAASVARAFEAEPGLDVVRAQRGLICDDAESKPAFRCGSSIVRAKLPAPITPRR